MTTLRHVIFGTGAIGLADLVCPAAISTVVVADPPYQRPSSRSHTSSTPARLHADLLRLRSAITRSARRARR
jgi:hypothetical protein